jgi:hypothetical protein
MVVILIGKFMCSDASRETRDRVARKAVQVGCRESHNSP